MKTTETHARAFLTLNILAIGCFDRAVEFLGNINESGRGVTFKMASLENINFNRKRFNKICSGQVFYLRLILSLFIQKLFFEDNLYSLYIFYLMNLLARLLNFGNYL